MVRTGQQDARLQEKLVALGSASLRGGSRVRQWLRVWRWPAGVVAGVILWVALVAVVGATTGSAATFGRVPGSDPVATPKPASSASGAWLLGSLPATWPAGAGMEIIQTS